MEFRIADTFTDSLARLTGDEQKAVKTTAFDLQLNPANPGMSFHKLDKAKDKQLLVGAGQQRHPADRSQERASLLLCYVDHHDKAYDWAERRKLETHPTTGAAQLVEIRETVKEIVVPVYVQTEIRCTRNRPTQKPLFAGRPMTNCSDTVCPPSGSTTSGRPPRTRCWPWRTTCRRSRRGAAGTGDWRQAARAPARRRPRRIPSIIPMPSAASA